MIPDQIETQLINKAVKQRNEMLETAKAQAQTITENAQDEEHRILEQASKSIEGVIGTELRAVHDRIVGGAQLQGRKIVLEARTEVLDKVNVRAMEYLINVAAGSHPGVDYGEVLLKLVKESAAAIGEDNLTVQANMNDADFLKEAVPAISKTINVKLTLDDEPAEVLSGVKLSNGDGSKTIENTLERRVEATAAKLRAAIAEKLGMI